MAIKTGILFHRNRRKRKCPSSMLANGVKRRRIKSVDWTELPGDVLQSIFNKLSFIDVLRAEAVCYQWYAVAEQLKYCSQYHPIPWLLVPPQEEEAEKHNERSCKLFDVEEGKDYTIKNLPVEIGQRTFIGSSCGYMFFIDEEVNLKLLNPLKSVQIELHGLDTLLGISRITKHDAEYLIEFIDDGNNFYTKLVQDYFHKVILTSDPCSDNNHGVILIYGPEQNKLAYYNGGVGSWSCLDSKNAPYHDVICYKNQAYFLGKAGFIEVWDLDDNNNRSPVKRVTMKPLFPKTSSERMISWGGPCTCRFYLVESCGQILLVVRFIGEFVNSDKEPVSEEDLSENNICPYRTLMFDIYQLDCDEERWVEVDVKTLEDRALFLGGNHSVSVSVDCCSGCVGNSIYFTDDYWCRMDEDYLYGGHDMGVFNLENQSVNIFYDYGDDKILPPPCWLLPKPW